MFYYSLVDPLPQRARRYIKRAAERYFELRKEFKNHNWYVWNSSEELESDILEAIQWARQSIVNTLNDRSGYQRSGCGGSGYSVSMDFVIYSDEQRKIHAEKYKGNYLRDYGTIDLTFQIIDDYAIKKELEDEGIIDDKS